MTQARSRLAAAALVIAFAAQPLPAQDVAQTAAPTPAQPPMNAAPVAPPTDFGIDLFYTSRAEAPLWLKDDASRAAAAKLVGIVRNAALDGLPSGAQLANDVEAAIARGQAGDEKFISAAWVQYVRALRTPVTGVTFGDPALKPKASIASAVLNEAARAPSLAGHVEEVSAVNPLYSAIRGAAIREGASDDPRVRATLGRLRLVPAKGRVILVDAASAKLWMLEDGRAVDEMKVIVGKTGSATPLLAGTIHYVTLNPYWHILDEVARRKVAPTVIKRGISYLRAARYQTMSDWSSGAEPVDPSKIDWKAVRDGAERVFIRQLPGANNMMGAVKFSFENEYDIFLHDTPHKELFAKPKRDLSLGCIRLEHADKLARWLLGRDTTPQSDEPEQHVQLSEGVPIYVSYLTANLEDGQLAFADDVYGLDRAPAALASADATETSGPSTPQ